MEFNDDMEYQTLKSIQKGGEPSGWQRGEDPTSSLKLTL
jgi:hypothetical protein